MEKLIPRLERSERISVLWCVNSQHKQFPYTYTVLQATSAKNQTLGQNVMGAYKTGG